jgi:hypothetical protein
MSYQEAFEAFNNGDFRSAAPMLEAAAREANYSSDIVNNAYTLALYRLGDHGRLSQVAFKVGMMLADDDPASAMDYFQRALAAGLDAPSVRRIGEFFERWAAPHNGRVQEPIQKVAHVLGCVLPNQSVSRYVSLLCSGLARHGIECRVFTTESEASWFCHPATEPRSKDIGIPRLTIASIEGDFTERAERIAGSVRACGAKATFYHADLTEQVTARVAAFRPTPIQINVNHGSEMNADLFDGRIHLLKPALERSAYTAQPAAWIPAASNIQERLDAQEPVSCQSLGIAEGATVSATFGDLQKIAGSGYVRALTEILKRFPQHFHLFAGAGDVRAIRGVLHSENVLSRVRFLGQVPDVAPLMPIIDIYLASFPYSDGASVLDAMGCGKPVVAVRSISPSPDNAAPDLVGIRELIAPGEANYIELADRIIRDEGLRSKYAEVVLERFRTEFQPEVLGRRYVEFLNRVVDGQAAGATAPSAPGSKGT